MISMKILLLIAAFAFGVFAQCPEPKVADFSKPLLEVKFTNRSTSEFVLKLTAASPNASWREKGREAAVLTVFVDDVYTHDIVLFGGTKKFVYESPLGTFSPGKHRVAVFLNAAQSAPNAKTAVISEASVLKTNDNAVASAPFIYLRPDTIGKFSDYPLLTFYETFIESGNVTRVRYSTIFTNEDGGTQSAALMARWGRMTDIEWVYEKVAGGDETIQGLNHKTQSFNGQRFGNHPLIYDASVNNNFTDRGCSPLRISPMLVKADLSNASRESIMDANPWTHRVMADEAFREGRIDPKNLGANVVADLRDYFYVDIETSPENAAIAVAIENDGEVSRSDSGDARLRIDRKGVVRIAVRRPSTLKTDFPASVTILCEPVDKQKPSNCRDLRATRIMRLDDAFAPLIRMITATPKTIGGGASRCFAVLRGAARLRIADYRLQRKPF